ncbi:MAG: ribonuclease P protein component 1 [Candidatus Aenigmarchaeota archaeon]|nr:ribonuclease P protein component 1 [Candidatus Aenigmarchaeota archaeon]
MRNIKNILQHELIGLDCVVVYSKNKDNIGIKGKIVDETMKTLSIETGKGVKKILKQGTEFKTDLDGKKVTIDGNYLVSRPEDRIKKKIKKW